MNARSLLFFLPALLVLAFAAGSCSSNSETATGRSDTMAGQTKLLASPTPPTATATARPATRTATPATSPTPASIPTSSPASGHTGLLALLDKQRTAEYMVSYRMEAELPGERAVGAVTFYVQPGRFRYDINLDEAGVSMAATLIITQSAAFLCSSAEGVPLCMKFPADEGFQQVVSAGAGALLLSDVLEPFGASYTVETAGTRQLLGIQASCFLLKSAAANGQICLNEDGIPLLIEVQEPDGTARMEATQLSASVPDDAFEPPYQVIEISS